MTEPNRSGSMTGVNPIQNQSNQTSYANKASLDQAKEAEVLQVELNELLADADSSLKASEQSALEHERGLGGEVEILEQKVRLMDQDLMQAEQDAVKYMETIDDAGIN